MNRSNSNKHTSCPAGLRCKYCWRGNPGKAAVKARINRAVRRSSKMEGFRETE